MVRTVTRTRHTIVRAAKHCGATRPVRQPPAWHRQGAAAKAATEVVLEKTNAALRRGPRNAHAIEPGDRARRRKTARRSLDKPARTKAGRREASDAVRRSRTATAPPAPGRTRRNSR